MPILGTLGSASAIPFRIKRRIAVVEPIVGEVSFTSPGTYTWIVPPNVTSVNAVVIGGGGGGQGQFGGGGGGGLGWTNNIAVTPGSSITVVVGGGGAGQYWPGGTDGFLPEANPAPTGGTSYFKDMSTCVAYGGEGGTANGPGGGGGFRGPATGGFRGGNGGINGGGGAGGYSGLGGAGGNSSNASGSAGNGGGGGGGASDNFSYGGGGGGGGTGIFGEGASGAAAVGTVSYPITGDTSGKPGNGGSNGGNAGLPDSEKASAGGAYGGGGGGGTYGTAPQAGGNGGSGAVRIMWGSGRAFPSTLAGIQPCTILKLDASSTSSYPGSGTTWSDISGSANNATLVNSPTFTSENSGAIVFNGTNQYANIADSYLFAPTTALTVDAWIRTTTISPQFQFIIGQFKDNVPTNSSWYLRLQYGAPQFGYYSGGASWAEATVTSSSSISINTWVHITGVWTGTTMKVYVNGINTGSAARAVAPTDSSLQVKIGAGEQNSNNSGLNFFSGRIAQVGFRYNTAWSDTEVLDNFEDKRSRFSV